MRPKLEVCVDSIESVLEAERSGVDRIELCSALEVGGLTPSIGLVKQSQQMCPKLSIFCMIRPRAGDFIYSQNEIQIMLKDIEILKSYGVNGFVFGVLKTDGTIDYQNCKLLLETASPVECTFHRAILLAFDLVSDPKDSLQDLIKLGFTRILTSGQSTTAVDGIENIAKLVELAQNRITVMAGAGVTENNIEMILNKSKVKEFHSSASVSKASQMTFHTKNVRMGAQTDDQYSLKVVSSDRVRKMIEIADKYQ